MKFGFWVRICVVLSCVFPLFCQPRVSPRNLYERVWCVVPMTGSGTPEDPRRPMFAALPPAPGEPPSRAGILAFMYQESDDGRFALVEFVAADRSGFGTQAILCTGSVDDEGLILLFWESGGSRRHQPLPRQCRLH